MSCNLNHWLSGEIAKWPPWDMLHDFSLLLADADIMLKADKSFFFFFDKPFYHHNSNKLMIIRGVGVCVCVCVCVCTCACTPLCLTLCDPMDWGHQAPLSLESSRQAHWNGLPFLLQRTFPTPGSNPCLLHLLHWQVNFLPLCCLGSNNKINGVER